MRDRFGGLTYPVAAAVAVRRYEPFRCTIRHDSRSMTMDVVHLSVSNATVFGGVLGMRVPGASIADGLLDVIVIERLSLPRLAAAVGNTVIGRHTPVHHVHALQVTSLRGARRLDAAARRRRRARRRPARVVRDPSRRAARAHAVARG